MCTILPFPAERSRRSADVSANTDREREKTLADTLNALFPERSHTPVLPTPAVRHFTLVSYVPVVREITVEGGSLRAACEYAINQAETGALADFYRYEHESPPVICGIDNLNRPEGVCTVHEHIPEQFTSGVRWRSWTVRA